MRKISEKDLINALMPIIIGGVITVIMVIIIIMILTMERSRQMYFEGVVKSMPLLRSEKIDKLGDLYIKLNNEFEAEIKNYELVYANRTNKKGDYIFYGVNGKENMDSMINDDYVNGIESIKYVKGNSSNRKDGESNFVDMLTFMSAAFGADIDKYSDEELEMLFIDLFKLTHTFSGTSTDLYPCNHGCSYVKYYCGDYKVHGDMGGDTVGFYRSDALLNEDGEYGLMFDPFLVNKKSSYTELTELAGDENELKTTYQYKDVKVTYSHTDDGTIESHSIVTKGDTVRPIDDEIYSLVEPEGFCPVCSGNRETFTTTTRKFAGCVSHVECHCVNAESRIIYKDADDETGDWVDWYMGTDKRNCNNYSVEGAECNHDCECEDECTHECADPELLDTGYYICEGHRHYACPGHIAVCCFGHTTLNLDVNILYYEGIINELEKIKDKN